MSESNIAWASDIHHKYISHAAFATPPSCSAVCRLRNASVTPRAAKPRCARCSGVGRVPPPQPLFGRRLAPLCLLFGRDSR